MEAERYGDAIKSFSDAIALNPKSPDAFIECARAYRADNKFDRSIADLNAAFSN